MPTLTEGGTQPPWPVGIAHQAIPDGDKVNQDRWSCARRQEMGMAGPTWRQLHGRGLARS